MSNKKVTTNSGQLVVGQVVEVTAERIAYGGDAVCRHEGFVIFVPFAATGDHLRVRVVEIRKNHARGVIEEIVTPSSDRRKPPCKYFGQCGGCQLQHLTYEAQLDVKAGFIRDALSRVGRIAWNEPIEIVHDAELGYRLRARVQIDKRRSQVGFVSMDGRSICDIEECAVFLPVLNNGLTRLRSSLNELQSFPATTEIDMIAGDEQLSFNTSLGGLSSSDVERSILGSKYLIRAGTFFQANAFLIDRLQRHVVADYSGNLALDLYCGVGLFTVPLARAYREVIGVEADSQSADLAARNLLTNGLNARVINSTAAEALKKLDGQKVDLVILDPPREGAKDIISALLSLSPAEIVYVSCDPVTLARDLAHLIEGGYELFQLKGFDLFPQTYHVEAVSRLERVS